MANILGADVEELRDLGRLLDSGGHEIETLINTLRTKLGNVHWTGPDSERYRGDWHNTHEPQLRGIANALHDAAKAAAHNAQQQEDASS